MIGSRTLVLKKSHCHSCGAVNGSTLRKGAWRFCEDISTLKAGAIVFEHATVCSNTEWWQRQATLSCDTLEIVLAFERLP